MRNGSNLSIGRSNLIQNMNKISIEDIRGVHNQSNL